MMDNEQREAADRPERVALTHLYEDLPKRLAETVEPYDIQTGLAELTQWLDSRQKGGLVHLISPAEEDYQSSRLLPEHLQSPALAARMLELEERDAELKLEERRAKLELELEERRGKRELELEERRAKLELELEERRAKLERKRDLEEHRAARAHRGWPFLRIVMSLAAAVVYLLSIIHQAELAFLGLTVIAGMYLLLLFIATLSAVRSDEHERRESAYRVLQLLLLRDDHLTRRR